LGINFKYQSKTEKEKIQNATKIFENLLNKELKEIGSKYQIKFPKEIISNSKTFA